MQLPFPVFGGGVKLVITFILSSLVSGLSLIEGLSWGRGCLSGLLLFALMLLREGQVLWLDHRD